MQLIGFHTFNFHSKKFFTKKNLRIRKLKKIPESEKIKKNVNQSLRTFKHGC